MHEYSLIYEFIKQYYIIIDSKQGYAYYYNDVFVGYLKKFKPLLLTLCLFNAYIIN